MNGSPMRHIQMKIVCCGAWLTKMFMDGVIGWMIVRGLPQVVILVHGAVVVMADVRVKHVASSYKNAQMGVFIFVFVAVFLAPML